MSSATIGAHPSINRGSSDEDPLIIRAAVPFANLPIRRVDTLAPEDRRDVVVGALFLLAPSVPHLVLSPISVISVALLLSLSPYLPHSAPSRSPENASVLSGYRSITNTSLSASTELADGTESGSQKDYEEANERSPSLPFPTPPAAPRGRPTRLAATATTMARWRRSGAICNSNSDTRSRERAWPFFPPVLFLRVLRFSAAGRRKSDFPAARRRR